MFGQTLTSCKCDITKRVDGRRKIGPCFNSFLFGFQPDRVPCLPPALHGRSDTLTLLTTAHVFEKLGPLLVKLRSGHICHAAQFVSSDIGAVFS